MLAFLPEGDANEAFLRNTVQASWNEYTARLDEAYSGKRNDPVFRGRAAVSPKREVLAAGGRRGDGRLQLCVPHSGSGRPDRGGAGSVLQQAMQAAQKTLEAQVQAGGDEAALPPCTGGKKN